MGIRMVAEVKKDVGAVAPTGGLGGNAGLHDGVAVEDAAIGPLLGRRQRRPGGYVGPQRVVDAEFFVHGGSPMVDGAHTVGPAALRRTAGSPRTTKLRASLWAIHRYDSSTGSG